MSGTELLKASARRALIAGGLAAAATGLAAAPAQANFQKTLKFSCLYPLLSEPQPLSLAIDAALPSTIVGSVASGSFAIDAVATANGDTPQAISLIEATSLSATSKLGTVMNGAGLNNVRISVPVTIPKQRVTDVNGDPFSPIVLTASGATPSITFPGNGPVNVSVTSLSLMFTAYDLSGTPIPPIPNPLGVPVPDNESYAFDVPCTLDPATQDTKLAEIIVTPGPEPVPTTTPTPTPTPTPAATPTPPSTPPPIQTPTPTPGPTPTTLDDPPTYSYGIAGSATLKNLVKGSVPTTGSLLSTLAVKAGDLTGTLKLDPSQAKLTALGFLPVTATVNVVPTAPFTGHLTSPAPATGPNFAALAKVRIKLPSIKTFGIQLAGGANCQTTQVSNIPLLSTGFLPLKGGTLTGTFSISNLSGCGALTGIVSPLTAGSGNSIALQLTKQ